MCASAMKFPLKNCCFCFDLKNGVFAIFIFHILTSLLMILQLIVFPDLIEESEEVKACWWPAEDVITDVMGIGFTIVIGLFGIAGLYKNYPYLLLPWLVIIMLSILIFFTNGIYILFCAAGYMHSLFNFVIAGVMLYFAICVLSYYKKMIDNATEENPNAIATTKI